MWLLKKLSDGTTKYLISENKCYSVGRKNCDIILEEDASISRKHCSVYIAKPSECPFAVNTLTGVWVVDEQSKYGTYLKNNNDWVKINAGQNKKLSKGSVIKFGLMENIWSLEYKPLIVCASGIPTDQKKKILSSLQLIDGCFKNSWCKECSLVIVNEITLTVKVVLALIYGVPIVTPAFLQKVVESVKNQLPLPKHEDYRPNIKEILLDKALVSLDVKECRKELFKGKKFVIPTKKQLETLSEIITSAGGSTELLSCNEKWEKLAEDNIILIQLPFNNNGISEELTKSVKEITNFLKNKYGRRVVPECEIAQAVAYASTEKFCNPKSTWFDIKIGERKEVDLGPVIVEETPLITEETRHSPPGVIPCSATMESEPLAQGTSQFESQSNAQKSKESQLNIRQEPEILLTERKRTHPPNDSEHELQIKKARKEQNTIMEHNQSLKNSSLNKKSSQNTSNQAETSQNKKNPTKSSCITNYFQKRNQPTEEGSSKGSSKVVRQNSNDFWNCDLLDNYKMKRKISSESEDSNGHSSRKKAKLPEVNASKPKTSEMVASKDIVDVVEQSKNNDNSMPFPPIIKTRNIQEEHDFTGFFEREKAEPIDDLNNTLFSLTLISPAYLKEDGSLNDPPTIPVNVKRFKKQKIISVEISLDENEEELLTGDWIEPHSNRHNISVGD